MTAEGRLLVVAAHGVTSPLDGVSRPLWELVRRLPDLGFEVGLLTGTPGDIEVPGVQALELPRPRRFGLHRGAHFSTRHSFGRHRRRSLDRAISEFGPTCAISYLLHGAYLLERRVPYVLVAQDVLVDLVAAQLHHRSRPRDRLKNLVSSQQLMQCERSAMRNARAVTVVSRHEAGRTRALYEIEPEVVANGVQSVFARDGDHCAITVAQSQTTIDAQRPFEILFVANLRAPKNEAAALRLAERLAPRLDGCTLRIAGAAPSPQLRKRLSAAQVEVAYDVEDLADLYRQADLFVAPHESGTGIKNSVLEAMASGVAVVATSSAAVGLSEPGRATLRIADSDDQLVACIETCRADHEMRTDLASAAERFVANHHSWDAYASRIAQLCRTGRESMR